MVELPTIPESACHDARVATPVDDYELLDFGRGRKLERWGPYVVETRDPLAIGEPGVQGWQADWIYVDDVGHAGQWEPTRSGLPREWSVTLAGIAVPCRLDTRGRVGLRGRDLPCGQWVRGRIEGCYDLENIALLNLFGGNGFTTAQALAAGASVVHVEADTDMLALARELAGTQGVDYVQENVMDYVEGLLRRQQRFDMIVLPAPALGHGPKGQLWDREVDLPRLVKYLPRLITDNCLGIWLSTDGGAITWKAESLGQLLHEVLPGCTIEPVRLGVQTADGRSMPAGVAARWFDETDFLQTSDQPLTAAQLEERLDVHMVSLGAAEEPARALADFPRAQQDFVLRCAAMVARTSSGMAFNFVSHVCGALRLMDEPGVEAWLLSCMDIYDTRGLHPAVAAFKDVETFALEYKARRNGLALDDVVNVLEAFAHGLNGRHLKVEAGDHVYTDTETLFLPTSISLFEDREDNFQLYKAMVVHQWAQTWSGTWRIDVGEALSSYPDYARALACFHALEILRLDALLSRELPGVFRHLQALREAAGHAFTEPWRAAQERLAHVDARVQDSLDLLPALLDQPLPEPTPYQGVLRPADVARVRDARIDADKQAFRLGLLKMQHDIDKAREQSGEETLQEEAGDSQDSESSPFKLREVESQQTPDGFSYDIELDGRPLDVPDNVKGTIASILQDLDVEIGRAHV